MSRRNDLCSFKRYEWHKGFYTDGDPTQVLLKIDYTNFFEFPEDDEFPYSTAYELLCGSCHHFALSLQNKLGHNPYIIEDKNKRGFHAFCQICKNGEWYYVDARGITTCFNEFMSVAKIFVSDEYIIRPVTLADIVEWEKDDNYNAEAYAFAEAVIERYKECYTLE